MAANLMMGLLTLALAENAVSLHFARMTPGCCLPAPTTARANVAFSLPADQSGIRHLSLRGGSDTGAEQANAAAEGYADQTAYQPPAQAEYTSTAYEASQGSGWPAAPAATYDQPTYQPTYQAAAAPQPFVPPAAPTSYQAQPQTYAPSAPASYSAYAPSEPAYSAPAAGYIPPPPKAAWDQSSLSFTRRFIDVFGWENISPIFYFVLGLSISFVRATLANGGEDDEFQVMVDSPPR